MAETTNTSIWGGLSDIFKQTGDFAKDVFGVYKDVYGAIKGTDTQTQTGNAATTDTAASVIPGSSSFSKWAVGGGALIVIVLLFVFLRK